MGITISQQTAATVLCFPLLCMWREWVLRKLGNNLHNYLVSHLRKPYFSWSAMCSGDAKVQGIDAARMLVAQYVLQLL
jgi:hypothetical protein